jgi:Amino acid synthesis
MDGVRKILFLKEQVLAEAGRAADTAVTRAAAIAVIRNPFAGAGHVDDLAPLFDLGAALGDKLMPQVVELLTGGSATSYGKAAIVGVNGDLEHGAALLHPKLGRPMRAAVGGGEAIISSNVKVAAAGASIDVPLAHKDNIWAFDQLDTMTVMVADAPRPDEVVVVMAVSDVGRPNPRVGKGRV